MSNNYLYKATAGLSRRSLSIGSSTSVTIDFTADITTYTPKTLTAPTTLSANLVGALEGAVTYLVINGGGILNTLSILNSNSINQSSVFDWAANTSNIITFYYVRGFSFHTVTQLITPDVTAPSIVSVTSIYGSRSLDIIFNENLRQVAPSLSAFTVNGGIAVNNVYITGNVVSLTLSDGYTAPNTVILTYAAPSTNPIQDLNNNIVSGFSQTFTPVTPTWTTQIGITTNNLNINKTSATGSYSTAIILSNLAVPANADYSVVIACSIFDLETNILIKLNNAVADSDTISNPNTYGLLLNQKVTSGSLDVYQFVNLAATDLRTVTPLGSNPIRFKVERIGGATKYYTSVDNGVTYIFQNNTPVYAGIVKLAIFLYNQNSAINILEIRGFV